MKKLMVAVLFVSLTSVISAEVNFDQGVNLDQVVQDSYGYGSHIPNPGVPR